MAGLLDNLSDTSASQNSDESREQFGHERVNIPEEKNNDDNRTQYLAAAIVTLSAFSAGTCLAWSSTALPLLSQEISYIKINNTEGSWIASLLNLGAFCGAILAGLFAERFATKKVLLSLAIPLIVSWLLIALSTSVYCFFVGRFIGGVAVGAISVAVPSYVAEMAQPAMREVLGNFYHIQLSFGIFFGFLLGLVPSVSTISMICGLAALVYFIAFLFMPESPVYLMTQGKVNEARNSLGYIRGIGCDIDEEISRIKEYIDDCISTNSNFNDFLSSKSNRKAMMIILFLVIFQQMTGISAILFYMWRIFSIADAGIPAKFSCIIVAFLQLITACISAVYLSKFERRRVLIISNILMGICATIFGLYLHFDAMTDMEKYNWVPIVSLSVFVSVYAGGVGPMPLLMMSELFPTNAKNKVNALSTIFGWFTAFMVTKYYQEMVDSIGTGWALWNYGSVCGICALLIHLFMPETKDKTLEQIQKELNGHHLERHKHIIEVDSDFLTC